MATADGFEGAPSAKDRTPYTIKTCVVVEGGWLKKPMLLPDTDERDGYITVKIMHENRNLSRILGYDMGLTRPWVGSSLCGHLCKFRDDVVDKLIAE